MTMIERVAKAILAAEGKDPEKVDGWGRPMWKSKAKEARAAIAAMREPTPEMEAEWKAIMGGGFMNSHSDRETWEAGIDGAMKEP